MISDYPTYSFKLEFFDERAELVRPYVLQYFTHNSEIEIFDVRVKKTFLKKTSSHNVQLEDLFIGNKILINGRQYEVIDYADNFTKNTYSVQMEHTYAMIKPGFSQYLGETLERIYQENLYVSNLKFGYLSREIVEKFYEEHIGKPFYENLVQYILSGPVIGIEIVGKKSISKWRQIIGPTNLETAKNQAPYSLRALYAKNTTENFAHGSDSPNSAERELNLIFGKKSIQLTSLIDGSTTLCIIKPHAVKNGSSGSIIRHIVSNGFNITGALMITLDLPTINEFLEVYRGVVEEYMDMTTQFASGPLIALELSKENALQDFRTLCGPRDPLVAKKIRPSSIRAQFGSDIILNAVHCTDLQEDSELECEYFFVLLNE